MLFALWFLAKPSTSYNPSSIFIAIKVVQTLSRTKLCLIFTNFCDFTRPLTRPASRITPLISIPFHPAPFHSVCPCPVTELCIFRRKIIEAFVQTLDVMPLH